MPSIRDYLDSFCGSNDFFNMDIFNNFLKLMKKESLENQLQEFEKRKEQILSDRQKEQILVNKQKEIIDNNLKNIGLI